MRLLESLKHFLGPARSRTRRPRRMVLPEGHRYRLMAEECSDAEVMYAIRAVPCHYVVATWFVDFTSGNDTFAGDSFASGHPFLTLAKAYAVAGPGDAVWCRGSGSTYSITSAITPPAGAAGGYTVTAGCKVTQGDLDGDTALYSDFPLIQVNNAAVVAFNCTDGFLRLRNLAIDGAGGATKGTYGVKVGTNNIEVEHCKLSNFTVAGTEDTGYAYLCRRCYGTLMTAAADAAFYFSSGGYCECSFADANACAGIWSASGFGTSLFRCVSRLNSGSNGCGIRISGTGRPSIRQCSLYGNAQAGVRLDNSGDSSDMGSVYGCVLTENGVYGIDNLNSGQNWPEWADDYNAFWNNSPQTTSLHQLPAGAHDVTLSADPFTTKGGAITSLADVWAAFGLNATAGGGAACKAVGYPPNVDLGAVQSAAGGGGGGAGGMLYIPNLEGV